MKNIQTLKLSASGAHAPVDRAPAPAQAEAPTVEIERPVAAVAPARPRTGSWRKRVVTLFVVDAVATLAAIAASGTVHDTLVRYFIAGAALAAALVVVVELAPKRSKAQRPVAATAQPAARTAPRRGFSKTKAALVLMMCLGIVAYFGGAGTFAGFTAETSNNGSNIASGTLTMSDTVNSGTACLSVNSPSSNNVNSGCNVLFNLNNLEPTSVAMAKVAIQNTGSLNASTFYVGAPYVNGALTTAVTAGTTPSSLTMSAGLEGGPVNAGDQITVNYGAFQQTWCATASAAAGATTISIAYTNASPACTGSGANGQAVGTFSSGATVVDANSDTTASGANANTDCFDRQTTSAGGGVAGATFGNLGFNPTTGNPLCNQLTIWIQEQTGGFNYCWYGIGSGAASGACTAPISVNLSSSQSLSGSTTSLAVGALNGNVANGDSIVVTQGANKLTCTAGAAALINATSITVSGCSGNSATYTTAAVVTDGTAQNSVNNDSGAHSVSSFDTTTKGNGHIELVPVTANGTITANGTDLPHFNNGTGDTRTFYVGIDFPSGTGATQNVVQALYSTLGITWHINQ